MVMPMAGRARLTTCMPHVQAAEKLIGNQAGFAVQVAAYTNGRNTVSEYDLLLLQHVLWQRPEESQRITDYLLGQLASDSGGQIDMLMQGALITQRQECQGFTEAKGWARG